MKVFRNITIAVGIIWVLCFSVVLISKLRVIDEMFMSFSIISLYLFTIVGVSYLVTFLILKIKHRLKTVNNTDYSK